MIPMLSREHRPDIVGAGGEVLVMTQRVDDLTQTGLKPSGLGQRLGVDVTPLVVVPVEHGEHIVGVRSDVLEMGVQRFWSAFL